MKLEFQEVGWRVWNDEHNVVWAQGPKGPPQVLQDSDSLCGSGIFETDGDDFFRPSCGVHDNLYIHRAYWESRGFHRPDIDAYLYHLMLVQIQDGVDDGSIDEVRRIALAARAKAYYEIVQWVGWIYYDRHPGYTPNTKVTLKW